MNYYMTFKNTENSYPKKETMTDTNNYINNSLKFAVFIFLFFIFLFHNFKYYKIK